jgi:lipopolysaccharide/colanic/teichoic acid biosynthesis glycosyltransferase
LIKSKSTLYLSFKRIFDIVCAILLLVLLLPVIVVIGIAILICDGGPVIYKQERTGLHNQPFIIYKFKTMKPSKRDNRNAHVYNWTNGVPDDFVFKTSSSHNSITKLGSFLRKYSLDEILQLINVIKGDMSIIGPRPEIPQITKYYNEEQKQRLLVRPGITGLAQVKGRSDLTHGEKIYYDLQYVQNCSFLLDMKILLLTVYRVISGKGSY